MKSNKYTRIFSLKETDELKNTVYDGDLWRKYRDRQNAMARARRKDRLNEKSAEQYEYFREQQHKKWLDKIAYNKAIEIVEKKIKHKKNYNQPINFIKHEDK